MPMSIITSRLARCALLPCAPFVAAASHSEGGTYELLELSTAPAVVSAGQAFHIIGSGYNIPSFRAGNFYIEVTGGEIAISGLGQNCYAAGNPPNPPSDRPGITSVPVSGLPAGNYNVSMDLGSDCFGNSAYLERQIIIYPNAAELKANHESPATGDVVSGVGVIRGWACYPGGAGQIGEVTYTVNAFGQHYPLPYGSIRNDTREICGFDESDSVATGYGGVVYWPTLGQAGPKTLRIYIDGVQIERADISIVTPPPTDVPSDLGFRKGASGQYIIDDFLGTGERVIIRWSEADQNFIIVDYN